MRIGIDVTPLLPVETGVDRYLIQLVRFLARVDKKTQYTVFVNRKDTGRYADLGRNFTLWPVGLRGRAGRLIAQQLIVPVLAESSRLDVLHSPSFFMPLRRGKIRHLLTVFDMTMFTRGECHTRFRRSPLFLRGVADSIRLSHRVIVPSSFVSREIVRLLPDVDPGKIRTIPLGIDPEFKPRRSSSLTLPVRLRAFYPYVLFVGTIEPRKNLPMLLQAYREAMAKHGLKENLVLAGRRGWNCRPVEQLLRSEELRHRAHPLGYVEREDLIRLYQNASVSVYPSLEEGFGLPPLEAMACGTPVIAARNSSLEENLSGAALLVPTGDTAALADAIAAVVKKPALRADLAERGLARARTFCWESTAAMTIECYRELAAAGQPAVSEPSMGCRPPRSSTR